MRKLVVLLALAGCGEGVRIGEVCRGVAARQGVAVVRVDAGEYEPDGRLACYVVLNDGTEAVLRERAWTMPVRAD